MAEATEYLTQANTLKFTGNWFIDAGILGFVNLMEEVYGWNLEILQKKINEDEEKVYYGYFPFAYLCKWLSDRKQKVNSELIKKLKEELEKKTFQNTKELFDFVWFNFICNLFKELWIKSKSKLIYKNEAYDKKNKTKQTIDYKNTQTYLQKIGERENLINEIQDKHQEEIKKILKKRELKKFEYDDLEKLINYNNGSISSELRNSIELLKEKHLGIINFLKEEWENNVINQQKFTEESLFYRIPIDSGFYKNFLFFNNFAGNLKQKDSFYDAICFNFDKEEILKKIDKTVNKFLPSEEEFSNINYTKLSAEPLKKQIGYLFVYLLCFTHAFENYRNIGYVMFYSNDLEFSYKINRKLKLYKKKIENSKNANLIFNVTWQQIIDSLVECKSSWSLENMYIISYQQLDNKTQRNVEYIGVPKLQASILLDDAIRENLNKSISYRKVKEKQYKWQWLIQEFIKGKPLYPIIFGHVNLTLNSDKNNKISLRYGPCLYSLMVEANILNFKNKNNKKSALFSEIFFDSYKSLIRDIKEDIRFSSFYSSLIKQISSDTNTKNRIARELLNALKTKDKNAFLNVLLKDLNGGEMLEFGSKFYDWVFEKIIKNEISYEMYGLLLVMNLLKGGESNE